MKRMMVGLLTLCLLLTGLLSTASASSWATTAVIDGLTADRVHLRSSPTQNSTSLGLYFTGTEVVCMTDLSESWTQVRIGAQVGYIRTTYLKQSGTVISARPLGVVSNPNSSWINVRQEPSTAAASVTTLTNGTTVTVLGETNSEWYYVQYNGLNGYIWHTLLTLGGASPTSGISSAVINYGANFMAAHHYLEIGAQSPVIWSCTASGTRMYTRPGQQALSETLGMQDSFLVLNLVYSGGYHWALIQKNSTFATGWVRADYLNCNCSHYQTYSQPYLQQYGLQ